MHINTISSASDTLDEIIDRNKERFGPAGVLATDVPSLVEALDLAVRFLDDCHEWNLETLKTKRNRAMAEIKTLIGEDRNP